MTKSERTEAKRKYREQWQETYSIAEELANEFDPLGLVYPEASSDSAGLVYVRFDNLTLAHARAILEAVRDCHAAPAIRQAIADLDAKLEEKYG